MPNPPYWYFLACFLLGSLPTGSIAAWWKGGEGLFNPGEWTTRSAGEVFRILGMPLGILVTTIDVIKGILAVFPIYNAMVDIHPEPWWILSLGGLLVVLGHCHSPWMGFRGGKGLATTFGVMLTLLPIPAILASILWGCLSFWGLSTKPGALSAAGAMPLLSIAYLLAFDPQWEKMNYLFTIAFLSVYSFWEYRRPLKGYLGLPTKVETPPHPGDQAAPTGT